MAAKNKQMMKNIGKMLIVAFFGFSAVTLAWEVVNNVGSGRNYSSEATIIATAKHYVKEQLKSPSSAKFCPQNELSIYEANDGIVVSGYVDADNSFGVKIRSNFTVMLTSDGKSLKSVYVQ